MGNDRFWDIEGFGLVRLCVPEPLIGRDKERWMLRTTGAMHLFANGKEVIDHLNAVIEQCRNAVAAIDALDSFEDGVDWDREDVLNDGDAFFEL